MKFQSVLVIALSIMLLSLSGCGSSGDKIGSTVKGARVAVMDDNKTIKADSDIQNVKPEIPEITQNQVWPQAGYDTVHVLPNAAIAADPKEIWRIDIGSGSSSDFKILARPVIGNGRIFTMDAKGQIFAVDASKGDKIWSFDTAPENADDPAISGGLGIDGSILYATTGFGEVLALNADKGTVIWRRSLQNPLRAAPTIADGRVYAVSIDNQLSALDAKTGEVLWHHNGISESATLMGASNPAVLDNSVVVAYSSGEIFNLRSENGRVSWSYGLTSTAQIGSLPAIADIRGLPVIDHGRVFAVSHSGRMAAIDLRTGDRSWEIDVGGINTPVSAGNAVFVLSNDDQLIAVQSESGRVMWVADLQHYEDPEDHDSDRVFWTGPVIAGNRLWLTNSLGHLVAFSPTDGSQMADKDLGEASYITPVTANGIMYVVTDDGSLVALR